jgi:PAS domain S-box-containing protein
MAEGNKKKSNILLLLLVFSVTLLWMFVFQEIKHLIIPDITMWGSHLYTNIYSALFAMLITWFVLKYRDKLKLRINKEIDSKQGLEREIDEAVSLLDATIESTVDGILVVDKHGKITKANRKFVELWKVPLSILETKDDDLLLKFVIEQLIEPDQFLEKVNNLYANPAEESYDILYFLDGRVYERYSKAQSINDKIIGRVWSFRDITGLKKSEERIKLFEHTIASINEIVNIADFNDNLIYVNRAFNEAYGYTEDEIIGEHSSIFWSDKNPKEVVEGIIPATLNQGWQGELINKRKDGSEFPIFLSTSVIRDSNNDPVALVGIAHDISERKRKEKINDVLYRISQAVQVTVNLDELYKKIHEILSELISVNNFYIALYDQQTDMISFPYFIDEDDEQPKPRKLRKGLTEYVIRSGEALLLYADQFNKFAETGVVELVGTPSSVWLGIPLKVLNNTIGVLVVQDYKEPNTYGENEKEILTFVSGQIASAIYKKKTEDQLINYTNELKSVNDLLSESEKMLKEMNSTKDKFFSIISHDLKGPYQGLLTILDLLISNYDDLTDAEKKEIFNKVLDNSKRTYNLLETLLQWARMQMGKIEFNKNNFNLWAAASEIIDLLFDSAFLKKIKIINSVDSKINLYADQNMIHLILRNLIANAIKFSKQGGDIIVSSSENDDYYKISVKDFGVGINQEIMDNLFRIDVQTSTIGTAKEKGTGLGLLLCNDMVNIHNGKIWVESVEGEGSKFTFSIPKS